MSTTDIFGAINEALLGCSQFHFKIISIIGDGAQCNRQFQKRFFNESLMDNNGRKYEGLMVDRIPHQPIFYISDPSHMVKKLVSSLSSGNRNIFKTVGLVERQLSLDNMLQLWLSFNDSAGLNAHPAFKICDFIKNSFQKMRVGPCIKVRTPHLLQLLDPLIVSLMLPLSFSFLSSSLAHSLT
jgi:hypothetical protein